MARIKQAPPAERAHNLLPPVTTGEAAVMKALRLIEGASYGPDELKILTTVFDDLWEQLAPEVRARAEAAGAARLKLANAVLAVAKQGPVELERVKNDTLRLIFAGPSAGVQAPQLTVVPSKRT